MKRKTEEEKPMEDEIRKRSEIEEKYKWDLTHIYASDEAWEKD